MVDSGGGGSLDMVSVSVSRGVLVRRRSNTNGAACPIPSGLTVRMAVTFFVVLGGGLTTKERLFVTLAWLPKATVQVSNRLWSPWLPRLPAQLAYMKCGLSRRRTSTLSVFLAECDLAVGSALSLTRYGFRPSVHAVPCCAVPFRSVPFRAAHCRGPVSDLPSLALRQAAIGPVALDYARQYSPTPENIDLGEQVSQPSPLCVD